MYIRIGRAPCAGQRMSKRNQLCIHCSLRSDGSRSCDMISCWLLILISVSSSTYCHGRAIKDSFCSPNCHLPSQVYLRRALLLSFLMDVHGGKLPDIERRVLEKKRSAHRVQVRRRLRRKRGHGSNRNAPTRRRSFRIHPTIRFFG